MNNCIVCDNKLTLSSTIKCEYCEFVACRVCSRKYILNEPTPKCMGQNCGREWTRDFIVQHLKKKWVSKEYKEHRENILYDQERALIPATQEVVNARKERDQIALKKLDIDLQINRLKRESHQCFTQIQHLTRRGNTMFAAPQEERRTFVKKCPVEDCPGYLSSQWKCGTCNIWACPDCHVPKGEQRDTEHTCDPDTLATTRLLAHDTKACPNCHIDIYKIDGCNQMWCVKCHTAFDWRTLRIERGVVHNPHYFQYIRDTNNGNVPRNPLDNPCGAGNAARELNARLLLRVANVVKRSKITILNREVEPPHTSTILTPKSPGELYQDLVKIVRNVVHLVHIEIPAVTVNYANRNLELRVRYLMRNITEQDFKIQLQRSEKRFDKKRALLQIYELVANTISDLLMGFINKCLESDVKYLYVPLTEEIQSESDALIHELYSQHIPQINGIIKYANDCLAQLAKTFSSKLIYFDKYVSIRN